MAQHTNHVLPATHQKNGVAERMIQTITEKAQSMMIDSQAPFVFWGEAVNTAVYLHQRTPNEGLTKRDNRDGYQEPYPTPFKMLQAVGKPSHDNDGNEIVYKTPLHHIRLFGCYASRLFPEPQRHGRFSPRSMPCMMVGYVHNSTALWRIWDPAFRVVRSQSDVIFDEERNAQASCLQGDQTDIFELPEETEYIEDIDSGDGFLQAQDYEMGGDELLHEHAGTSRTGEGHGNGDHDWTDDDTDHNLPNADNRRSLPAKTGVRSRPLDEEDAPPVSRESVVHNRHLRRENHKARRTAAMTKQSCQPQPPRTNRVTRSPVKISSNALIIMAKVLASTSTNRDPFTYVQAMDNPQRDDQKRALEEECTSILLNHTFTTINSWEARQLRVKPIGSKWVYRTKHNPDGTIRYKTRLVIKGYEQTDFGETYAPVGKLTTSQYLISLVGKHGWIIDHLDMVTAFLNPEVDDDDIYTTLPEGSPQEINTPTIIVQLKKALYGLKLAPRLWHNDINTFLLSLEFTQSQADPNLYLRSDGILMLLYVDDFSMLYPKHASKAAIEVKARLSEKYKITNVGPACQFLGTEIHREENGTGISLGQKVFITTILKRFNMQNAHDVSPPMDPNVKLDLAENRGEKELKDIKGYQAIVGSLMDAALATRPDISFAVAALCWYNPRPFTSHLTAAKRVLQYLKSTTNFRLHFSSSSSTNQLTG